MADTTIVGTAVLQQQVFISAKSANIFQTVNVVSTYMRHQHKTLKSKYLVRRISRKR